MVLVRGPWKVLCSIDGCWGAQTLYFTHFMICPPKTECKINILMELLHFSRASISAIQSLLEPHGHLESQMPPRGLQEPDASLMLPRCFPDVSQVFPRWFQMPPDASTGRCFQVPPDASRCLQMLLRCFQMPPDAFRCPQMLPDASRCLQSASRCFSNAFRCLPDYMYGIIMRVNELTHQPHHVTHQPQHTTHQAHHSAYQAYHLVHQLEI